MKKTISLIVALAMVFVMCIPAFATEKPTDVPSDATALGTYYAELLANGATVEEVSAEMIADAQNGVIDSTNYMDMFVTMMNLGVDQNAVINIVMDVVGPFQDAGIEMPNINEILPPSGEGGEGNEGEEGDDETLLPDDDTAGGAEDLLNTILGILGSIGDMIFGGGDSGDEGDEGTTDDAWGDDTTEDGDSDDLISDTGDTTVLSVAAVALVAGAALVLTRKKSEDAE